VAYISQELCENDLILIMSNGSFGGLLAEMKKVLKDRYSC
jgi:UDP-N-acetylmuramate-alanine ligase